MNTLSFRGIDFLFREFPMNSLPVSRIVYKFLICIVIFLWIHNLCREFTICFANSAWFHYPYRGITMNLLSFSRHHFSLWIHHLFRDITMNSLYISRIHFEYTSFSANLLWIDFFSRNQYEINTNSLSVSRFHLESIFLPNHYGLIICYAILLWIQYPFREITVNTLSISRIFFLYTICFADISLYSLSISLIHY